MSTVYVSYCNSSQNCVAGSIPFFEKIDLRQISHSSCEFENDSLSSTYPASRVIYVGMCSSLKVRFWGHFRLNGSQDIDMAEIGYRCGF